MMLPTSPRPFARLVLPVAVLLVLQASCQCVAAAEAQTRMDSQSADRHLAGRVVITPPPRRKPAVTNLAVAVSGSGASNRVATASLFVVDLAGGSCAGCPEPNKALNGQWAWKGCDGKINTMDLPYFATGSDAKASISLSLSKPAGCSAYTGVFKVSISTGLSNDVPNVPPSLSCTPFEACTGFTAAW